MSKLDYLVATAPFVVLAAIAAWTVRCQRRCLVCHRHHKSADLRRRHEQIAHSL